MGADGQPGDDIRGVSGFGSFGDVTNRGVVRRGVVIRNEQNHEGHEEADQGGEVDPVSGSDLAIMAQAVREEDMSQGPKGSRGGQGADQDAKAEQAGGIAFSEVDREDSENSGEDGDASQDEGISEGGGIGLAVSTKNGEVSDEDASDEANGVGFKHVGSHAGAVAHIFAHVVGNGGGVAGIILFEFGFELADEICPDVGGLGVDAAPQAGEDADEGCAQGKSGQAVDRGAQAEIFGGDHVEGSDGKKGESHDEKAGDGATIEGVAKGGGTSDGGGLCRADIGHDGNAHAKEACGQATGCTHDETDAGGEVLEVTNGKEEKDGDDGNGLELSVEVSGCTLLNGGGDFAHALIAVRLTFDPCNQAEGCDQSDPCGDEA